MENLIECKISKEDLKILYKKLCVDPNTEDTRCDKCILSNIEWVACIKEVKMDNSDHIENKPVIRDLCFAIWHDDILSDNPVHYHH